MKAETLKKSILQYAMEGKLVPQNPNDEPAFELLKRINTEKEKLIKEGKIKKDKNESYIFKGEDNKYYEQIGSERVDITDEIPFELPNGWLWCRLGNIGDWGSGSTPNKSRYDYYRNGTIYWLKTGDLNDDYINDIPEKITELALKETSVKIKPVGSLLIAMYGATIGKLGILNIPATTNQACCACVKYADINTKYLFYYLLSERDNLRKRGEGGAQPNISREKIIAYLFPMPPLAEQQRIVDKLEQILPLIKEYGNNEYKLSKLNQDLPEKIKQSILQYAVQGKLVEQSPNDEPASVLLKQIKSEKEKLIKEGKIKKDKKESFIYKGEDNNYYERIGSETKCINEEIPFDIPDTWEYCRLKNIVLFENGDRSNNYPTDDEYVKEGIPFWGAKDIIKNKLTFNPNLRFISQQKFDCLRSGKLQDMDFICLLRGAVGKWAEFNVNKNFNTGFINAQMVILRLISTNILEWFKIYLNSPLFTMQVQNKTTGSAVAQMSAKDLSEFLIVIPPINEQFEITIKTKNLINTVNNL